MKHFKRKKLQSFFIGLTATTMVGVGTPSIADHYSDGGWSRDRDSYDRGTKITFIHSGDFHGDYHPHTNGRGDASGRLEGGIARGLTVIKKIRRDNDNVIHVHTGDTIHGSGEASITKGMALVKLVDQLGIDVSTPGNWEFAYSPYRYMQFFGVHDNGGTNMDITANPNFSKMPIKFSSDETGDVPTFGSPFRKVKYVASYNANGTPNMVEGYNRWGMVASNVYENGSWALYSGVTKKGTGMNLTPPYRIIEKNGVKIGFIGCTTNRGPQVVSSTITTGVTFSNCKGGVKFPQNRPIDWDDQAISHGPWIVDDPATGAGHWQQGNKVTGNPASAEVQAGNRNAGAETTGWNVRPHNNGDAGYKVQNEIVKWTKYLRDVEGVDLVAVMSEAGIAENVYAAENLKGMDNGPDMYFSSDMHEETNYPVIVTDPNGKKVIVVENPEDIAQISQLDVIVKDGRITSWSFKGHDIDDSIWPNWRMADLVNQVDQEIADMIADGKAVNPYNGHKITHDLYEVVGEMDDMILERNRFSTEGGNPGDKIMPGVVEGTGHALVTDMFRKLTGADVGGIRGFRYTNSVLDGDDITYKSLYHFFPIGPQVAVGSIPTTPTSEVKRDANGDPIFLDPSDPNIYSNSGAVNPTQFVAFPRSLQQEMELAGNSTMNPNVPQWGGGWFWNYSGIKMDLQPTGKNFDKWGTMPSSRVANLELYDNPNGKNGPIDESYKAKVTYASYYYHEDYNRINRNQLVPGGACPNKKLSKDCVMAKTDIRILVKEKASGDYVMVDTMEYDDYVDLVYDTTDDDKPLAVLDTVEALGRYINAASITVYDWDGGAKAGALRTVAGLDGEVEADDFVYPRINLVNKDGAYGNDLTDCTVEFGFPCIEPLRGAQDGHQGIPGTYIRGTADAPAASGSF